MRIEDLGTILRHSARRASSLSSSATTSGSFSQGWIIGSCRMNVKSMDAGVREGTQMSNQRIPVARRGGHARTRAVEQSRRDRRRILQVEHATHLGDARRVALLAQAPDENVGVIVVV